jgi:hypothetical protein
VLRLVDEDRVGDARALVGRARCIRPADDDEAPPAAELRGENCVYVSAPDRQLQIGDTWQRRSTSRAVGAGRSTCSPLAEVARRIRAQPWGESVRLVALTGWGQEEHRRLTREAGFDEHLTKPVDRAALEHLLAEPPRLGA